MAKNASALTMSTEEQICLKSWESAHSTPQQVVLRCRILLGASEGKTNQALAAQLNVNRHTVELWRQRGRSEGIQGIWKVAAGRGRKPRYDQVRRDARPSAAVEHKTKA